MKENLDWSCGAETLPGVFDSISEGYRLIKIINNKFKGGGKYLGIALLMVSLNMEIMKWQKYWRMNVAR